MSDSAPSGVVSTRPAAARDFDGLYKALLDSHPREALKLLCGARIDGRAVILDGPTELPRQRSRQSDKVFLVPNEDGGPADVYHIEIQVKRTEDFQERMVSYWASLALKYRQAEHRIHQIVLWPRGGGYPGQFRRDRVRLDYRAVSVPDDLDAEALLASPLAGLALCSHKAPPDVMERLAEHISKLDHNEEKQLQIDLSMLAEEPRASLFLDVLRRSGMTDILRNHEIVRELREESRVEGRVEGLVEGRDAAHVEFMRELLSAKYGDVVDLDDLAKRLVDRDHKGSIARIVGGATLDELRAGG